MLNLPLSRSCRKYIFRDLILVDSGRKISKQLTEVKKFFDNKPTFANRVHIVHLSISFEKYALIFIDPNFTSILQLFVKSPMPPHELCLGELGSLEDPMLVIRQLGESFFSQTLTILRVGECVNFPLHFFLICPRLREVFLGRVEATDKSYDKYPVNHCSGREAPLLEVLNYRNSHSLVEQMIAPPLRFSTPVVLW